MKQKTTQSSYESPLVRVRALSLERGFALSGPNWADKAGKPSGNDSYDVEEDF